VLSFSNREVADNDLVTKLAIYAALEIPAYWIIDRRDQSVWVYTQPRGGQYTLQQQLKDNEPLPAPGLEFLRLTPAQIVAV
jgi:Uma2 family endonuclease